MTPQLANREAVAVSLFAPLAIREANRSSSGRAGRRIDIGGPEMPIGFPFLAVGVESSRGR
jgi:hypothetical protein